MNWFGHRCERWRERICLRASGVLAEAEQRELQEHLRACVDCRSYSAEIQSVATPLAGWEKNFARLQPDKTAPRRWTRAILAGETKPARPTSPRWTPRLAAGTIWRELIWPCRHAWSSMAALWLVICAVRFGMSGGESHGAMRQTPAIAAVQSWEEQLQLLAELIPPANQESSDNLPAVEPPRRRDSRPRSERLAGQLLT